VLYSVKTPAIKRPLIGSSDRQRHPKSRKAGANASGSKTMPNRPKEYIVKVSGLFGKHISGPILGAITILLGIASAIYANDPRMAVKVVRWAAWTTGAVTILLVFVAQYDAWLEELIGRTTEEAKNLKPDLQGTFSNVSIRQFPYADQSKPGAWINFMIFACNRSHAETTIKEMVVTASDLSGRAHRFTKDTQFVLLAPWNVFRRGVGLSFSAQAGLDGIEFNMIDRDSVRVSLIDAFGIEHALSRAASDKTDWRLT
jgi:hypothetical protein